MGGSHREATAACPCRPAKQGSQRGSWGEGRGRREAKGDEKRGGGGSPRPGLASKPSTPGPRRAAFLPSFLPAGPRLARHNSPSRAVPISWSSSARIWAWADMAARRRRRRRGSRVSLETAGRGGREREGGPARACPRRERLLTACWRRLPPQGTMGGGRKRAERQRQRERKEQERRRRRRRVTSPRSAASTPGERGTLGAEVDA